MTLSNQTSLPHVERHAEHGYVCPCCGSEEGVVANDPNNHGGDVFTSASCNDCGGKWRDEYRLYATRNVDTQEVVIHPNTAVAALELLNGLSWLDEDPCDSECLAEGKRQAREALALALKPN